MKKKDLLLVAVLVFISINIQALNRIVSGVVTNEQGVALDGVSIISKITNNSAISSADGKYSIKVADNDILRFAFIGKVPQEVEVRNQKVINITLKTDVYKKEEMVKADCASQPQYVLCGEATGVRTKSTVITNMKSGAKMGQAAYFVSNHYDMDYNTENYASINENGYKQVTKDPLSTFSVDVDRASYTNIRRFLNNGQLPPQDAVRVEEMVNYFNYDYQQPEGKHPFSVQPELAECPWNKEHYLLKVGIKGREIEKDNLPPSNLVFLIDVSGSMSSHNKLPLLKSSFRLLVNELRAEDYVSIVVYAGAAGVVLEPTSGKDKKAILKALDNLEAGGSTAGGAGLKLAYKLAKENYQKHTNNRIVLATDGDFNVGISSNGAMEDLVERERESGIYMTVLGFGMGNYKDDRMEIIADKGNGNYAYIDNLQEAQKTLVSEFGGTLFTIAKDVKFQIEFNPSKIMAYRLIGYENRLLNNEDFNDDKKDAGEIGAGHTVTALYEIIPVGAKDSKHWVKSIDQLKYQNGKEVISTVASDEWLTIKLRYKQPDSTKSILLEKVVSGKVQPFVKAHDDFKFAASVAAFGMLLRNSEYKGDIGFSEVKKMAIDGRGKDTDGFKAEMMRLIDIAESLSIGFVSKD